MTDTATKTGPRTVLFKYVVKSTDKDTDKLQIVSVQSSGYNITDIAGNKFFLFRIERLFDYPANFC